MPIIEHLLCLRRCAANRHIPSKWDRGNVLRRPPWILVIRCSLRGLLDCRPKLHVPQSIFGLPFVQPLPLAPLSLLDRELHSFGNRSISSATHPLRAESLPRPLAA